MLVKGWATDPATGRPIVEVAEEREQVKKKAEEDVLRDRAAYVGMLASEPGKLVVGIVKDKLLRRLETLMNSDPESKALVGVLSELGQKDNWAGDAVEKLMTRHIKKD